MSAKKFKFVSPGVFLNEIDNSQLPQEQDAVGPVVIGRALRGPALRPVRVNSFSEFVEIFGNPIAGNSGDDVWREGNGLLAPTYGAYATQAYLRNSGPVNFIRLLGVEDADKTSDGDAGWTTGCAHGIFVGYTGSAFMTASLAAVIYSPYNNATVKIASHGTTAYHRDMVKTGSVGNEFLLEIVANGATTKTKFNFSQNDDKFIRKVLNTNPTKTNSNISATTASYWLGSSFETYINENILNNTNGAGTIGVAFTKKLEQATFDGSDWTHPAEPASTGWVFCQDLSDNHADYSADSMQKLFRIEALDSGEDLQRNYKISIRDITAASKDGIKTYGHFTVEVRRADDTDASPVIVERFSNCNLNPNSSDYIARKIGDMYQEWDGVERRYKMYGEYANMSSLIRVVMDAEVDAGAADPQCLPWGYYGPLVPHRLGSADNANITAPKVGQVAWALQDELAGGTGLEKHIFYPKLPTRTNSNDQGTTIPEAYWGVRTSRNSSTNRHAPDYQDYLLPLPSVLKSAHGSISTVSLDNSFVFTLDDIKYDTTNNVYSYAAGNRVAGNSITAAGIGPDLSTKDGTYRSLLVHPSGSTARFTMPLNNGSDGVDIKEMDPFNNRVLASGDARTNYARASIDRAIDSVRDPEVIEMNLMSIPGVDVDGITQKVVETCEARADALAVIDVKDTYCPPAQLTKARHGLRVSSGAETVARAFELRGLNSSYGCAYFPWIKIYDEISDRQVWCPPSVAALGVMANTEERAALWFAPAGFNRGGLTEGSAGIPVIGVSEKLTSKERDALYDANINPIASFPAEGIVVFGQKTLQVTASALDRINVRRLLIYVKKEISRIASGLLFDPNVSTTWDRFTAQVTPFLESVKVGFGLSDFKVVLDETTTTPDLVDRNIIYAKIFLKPAKAVEFIAVDFIVTNTGAAFED
tara:strand:+ start:258 stop:3044 length:2787 start_codon:yes stop_codon:yes gene_type:complete